MPVALSIHPFSDVLNMYGDPDSSSSFSLSGNVSILLTSPSSPFVRRKTTTRIALQSLSLTFEGQSETITPATGYAPFRLCSITREILPGEPVDISNEGHEDSDQPCIWNVVFDITVPGWLPTTSSYGDASLQATGTSYAIYATATFVDISHNHSTLSFASICGSFCSRKRTVDAQKCPIIVRRFVDPQCGSSNAFPMSIYAVDAHREPNFEGSSQRTIPNHVLEKIQVIATIPSAASMDETSFPFVLRIRGKGLNSSERKQLKITEFSIDVEQVEIYRNNLSRNNTDWYPIPSQTHQPPHIPLRDPHPIHTLYDTGFIGSFGSSIKRSFSILAPNESGRYIISGDGRIFNLGCSPSSEDNWYILGTNVSMLTEPCSRDWAGSQERRISESSPLFSVEHYIHVVISCEYDLTGETMFERLHFSLPMRHVNVSILPNAMENEVLRRKIPCVHTLPAYSQLFYSNGERKLDCSISLPPYEPPTSESESSPTFT